MEDEYVEEVEEGNFNDIIEEEIPSIVDAEDISSYFW